ncbi:MAG TPA: DUF2232 domain-containing protein [Vicinamibacteria bacterium]|nr:DUF2232 domain-containing protein [Vicinamibacteria bacterium]
MSEPERLSALAERGDPRPVGLWAAGVSAALLYSVSLFSPYLSPLAFVSAFPLIVQRLRGGLGGALLATLGAASVVAFVFSPSQAGVFCCFLAAPGLLMGEAMARGRGMVRGCGWAFALLSLEISAVLIFASGWMEAHALEPLEQLRSTAFVKDLTPERLAEWTEQVTTLHDAMAVVYPAFYIILGAFVVLANAALLRFYLARRDPGWLDGDEFEGIRWPLGLAVAFVVSGASVALPLLRPAAYNVLLVLAFFFALEGLAVVAFYSRRLAGPPLLRVAVVILVLANPWASQILALLGLFDIWIDFRKWAEPPATGA